MDDKVRVKHERKIDGIVDAIRGNQQYLRCTLFLTVAIILSVTTSPLFTLAAAVSATPIATQPKPPSPTASLVPLDTAPLRTFVPNHLSWFDLSAVFSPDGRYILINLENAAQLLDMQTSRVLHTFSAPRAISGVAFSPDSHYVVTDDYDHVLKLWDVETGQAVRSFLVDDSQFVNSVAVSPDDSSILIISVRTYSPELWDVQTGQLLHTFGNGKITASSAAYSPDGRYVLTGNTDNTARLWDVHTGDLLRAFTGHSQAVSTVAYSPDGRYVLTGSSDNTAKLWDAQTGKVLHTFTGHNYAVLSVAFSPDGRYVLTGSLDTTAKLWDMQTG